MRGSLRTAENGRATLGKLNLLRIDIVREAPDEGRLSRKRKLQVAFGRASSALLRSLMSIVMFTTPTIAPVSSRRGVG
jgi:hypothetical protein